MKSALLFFVFLFTAGQLKAQTDFQSLNKQAMDAYQKKEFRASGELFDKAFKANGKPTATDYYNAACSWALAGNSDAAFGYLDKATTAGWDNVAHVKQDADLKSLRADKRWQPMLGKLTATVAKAEAGLNQPLKKELEQIYMADQGVRGKIDSVQKNFGMKSKEWEALMKEMGETDERNLKAVISIIEKHGWPGKALAGKTGSLAAFLVIQHSDLKTQEKYFPLLQKAAENGDLHKGNLALLEDRILVGNGKPQKYGSQLKTDPETGKNAFSPIEDEANVDKRRAAIGLEPMADYARRFGIEYVPVSK